jgi:small subunit ribosomal protein S16
MLKIRLTRMGKKHQPTYRIVVTPKENPVAGTYIDLLGTYNPIKGDVQIDTEKAIAWLNKGAQPSERLARILSKAGVQHKSVVVKVYTPKAKEEEAVEAPVTEAPAAEPTTEEVPAEEAAPEAEVTPEVTEETPTETPAE